MSVKKWTQKQRCEFMSDRDYERDYQRVETISEANSE